MPLQCLAIIIFKGILYEITVWNEVEYVFDYKVKSQMCEDEMKVISLIYL